MKNYINYHSHSSMSNLSTPDSTISNKDRTLRAIELDQSVVSYVEHGSAISFLEGIPLSQEHNIKPLLGSEVYFVINRFEKDRTNAHLILLAKNENGRRAINRIISEANVSGFYYKPRCDMELVLSLPKNDVWVTSACVGGIWKYENADEIILKLFEHFGRNNFFLEVQAHHVDKQRELNKHILELSNRHNIMIIAGLDSHMLYPEQAKQRDDYLLSRGIEYPDEENWFLDFCSYETFYQRFLDQGILNKHQIEEALENTNIFQNVEKYDSIIFDKNIIKLPTIYPDKTQDERDAILKNIIWKQWEKEKVNVPSNKHKYYEEEINKELDVIVKTKTSDYFILDHEVVKKGKEMGGSITLTGRGSSPSFYTSKLLGLTTIDRISASVKLFPERFISAERLIEAKSLPDIDLNLGTPKIFAKAQEEVLGCGHSYSMVAFGTLRSLGAWKLYARVENVPFEVANLVSEQIQQYELDLKHVEDEEEKDELNILDYIDSHYHRTYEESKKYLGLINNIVPHPCLHESTLILTRDGYKKISDIKIGDFVFTHKNRFMNVLNTMSRKSDDNYLIKIGGQTIRSSGSHPFFVTKKISDINKNFSASPKWMQANLLNKDYYIGFGINNENIIPEFGNLKTSRKDFWWTMGYFIGNGYLSGGGKIINKGNFRINFSCPSHKVDLLTNKLDKLKYNYHFANIEKTNREIGVYNKELWDFLSLFGKYAYGKFIPNFVIDLPINLLSEFINGYLEADGCFRDRQTTFKTVSEKLAYGIQACIHKVYRIPCTIHVSKEKNGVINGISFSRRDSYTGQFSNNGITKYSHHFYSLGYLWIKVTSIDKDKNYKVYNIEVNKDNSYTANNAIVHNCGYLLFSQGKIEEEFGLIKIKTGDVEHICACCEGHFAEDYKLMKNDLLKVSVVDLIYRIYKRIGIEPHPLPELIKLCDDKVWDIYKNACTIGVNQFEQPGSSGRGAKYAPRNISEISAFVAAIRPGFKSNYKQFEAREHFEYGIKSLDSLIQTKEFPESYMLYQENAMQVLAYSGIPISETYEIVKNIAKKRAEKVYKYKEQFIKGMKDKLLKSEHQNMEDASRIAEMTWKIIEDSAFYSFNCSHSYAYAGDSLYGAYLKSHYPVRFYEVFLQMMEEDGDKDRLALAKIEAEKHFHIKFPPYRFGQDNRGIVGNFETNEITQSLKSIKGFNHQIGDDLYNVGQLEYKDWLDFLIKADESEILCKKFESLIKINYFEKFGNNKKLYDFYIEFISGKNRYSHKLTEKTRNKRLPVLQELWDKVPNERFGIYQQITYEKEILGSIQMVYPVNKRYIFIEDLNEKFAPRILGYCLATGKTQSLKIQKKIFANHPFMQGDILYCNEFEKKNSVTFKDGKYVEDPDNFTWWLPVYRVVNDYKEIIEA